MTLSRSAPAHADDERGSVPLGADDDAAGGRGGARSSGAPRRRGGARTARRRRPPPGERERRPRPARRRPDGPRRGDGARVARRCGERRRLVAQEHGQPRRGGLKSRRRREAEAPLARLWLDGAGTGPPGAPRTARRCCAPSAAMVPRQGGIASNLAHAIRRHPVPASPAPRRARAPAPRPPGRAAATAGRRRASASRWRASVPTSPRVIGPVSAARDAEGPGVAEGLLDQRAVDRQRSPPRRGLRPRRARRSRRAGRRSRPRRAPPPRGRRPCSRGQPDRRSRRAPRPSSARSAASSSSPSIAMVAPWRAATARSVSANATSGWNAPICVPAAIAGSRTSAPSTPLVWTIAWPPYRRSSAASRADRVVRDGQDDQLDLVEDGVASAKARAPGTSERKRSRRAASRSATATTGQPARCSATPSAVPTAPAPTMPIDRRLARLEPAGADGVVARLAVGVIGGRRARRRLGSRSMPRSCELASSGLAVGARPGRGAAASRSRADRPPARPSSGLAVRFHATSLASDEVRQRATPRSIRRPSLASAPASRTTTGSPRSATCSTSTRAPVTLKILLENALRHAGGGIVDASRRRDAGLVAPGRRDRGRDPVHAGAGDPPGLHRRAGGRRPRGDARRDGGARRRPGAGQPARAGRPRHRPLGPGRPVRDARRRSPSTSRASTSATASATSSCAGPRPRSATCGSCRRGPASSTRSTSSTWRRSSPTADEDGAGSPSPTRSSGTDSHTTMINGLGVLGYGVGGIEAEAVAARPAALPADAADRRRAPLRRAAARLDRDRPRARRHRDAARVRRRRRVRRVRRRRPRRAWRSPTGRRSRT